MWLNLYMIALVPDAYLTDIVDGIRREFSVSFHAKAALRPPVHITLQPPFRSSEQIEPVLQEAFSTIAAATVPFTVELRDYGFFRDDVVFIHVEKNPLLERLQEQVAGVFQQDFGIPLEARIFREYNPHITIGYRDIPRETFPAIRERYSELRFRDGFTARSLYFWKHNGRHWEVLQEFPFRQLQ